MNYADCCEAEMAAKVKDSIISAAPKIVITFLQVLVGLAAAYYVIFFLYIAISRIAFPFPFDRVEGAVLVQANRILLGQSMYVEPGVAYIPLVYQPFYLYAAAIFIKLFSVGFFAPRLLSVLASCGCIALVFLITRKLSGVRLFGLISAGLFAATNGIVWAWFDFAKVDMLCVLLFLGALYFLIQDDNRGAVLAGVLFALSFFTKQTAGPIVFLIFIAYFFIKRRQTLLSASVFAVLACAGTLLLNYESKNNLYLFYVYELPPYHHINASPANITYIVTSILQPVLVVLGVILLSIVANIKKFVRDPRYCFFAILMAGVLVLSIAGALVVGSTRNAFIPAYAVIAIVFGLSLQYLQENIEKIVSEKMKLICSITLLGICLLQFSFLQYKSKDYVPTAYDFKRGDALINYLKKWDGEFIIPTQNYLGLYLDKTTFYQIGPMGEFDGRYGQKLPAWEKIQRQIANLVHTKKVSFIFMEEPLHTWSNMTCQKMDVFKSNSKFVPTLYRMSCY
jgi:hypothetical protein